MHNSESKKIMGEDCYLLIQIVHICKIVTKAYKIHKKLTGMCDETCQEYQLLEILKKKNEGGYSHSTD